MLLFSYILLLNLAVSYRQPTRVLYFYSLSLPTYSLAVQRTSSLRKGELQVTPSDLSCLLKKAKAALILFPCLKIPLLIIQQQLLTLPTGLFLLHIPGRKERRVRQRKVLCHDL